ncbi:hypothetical protein [Thiomicrorhabdus aquaedulcis]|uniref:hypothetical protein n=1 Tax=Thiomicrorhabdus aquaedulcis TaxID=2211106 RepID=UPI000FDBEEA8|nr:hypothetical protein [Thiomicrorhabdus aquaedulcis]
MAHHRLALFAGFGLLSFGLLLGWLWLDKAALQVVYPDLSWLFLSIVLMSVAVGWFADSVKTGFLQAGLSGFIVMLTLGALGWLGFEISAQALLGLVVVISLLTSNLIHLMLSVLREMARGVFQFDALAEALNSNNVPIFLSNSTTALGFAFAAWFDSSLHDLAWMVAVGALLSYLTVISWLPLILLSWLLEFRVGSTSDRHGFGFIAQWLIKRPKITQKTVVLSALASVGLLVYVALTQRLVLDALWMTGIFFGVFLGLFWFFWRRFALALLNVYLNLIALLFTLVIYQSWITVGNEALFLTLLFIPMGLIVDDGIHFFTRYVRAKNRFLNDTPAAVKYAMASVARPIWMSSVVLFAGLSVLLLSNNGLMVSASAVTLVAIVISTVFILGVLPALLINGKIGAFIKNTNEEP